MKMKSWKNSFIIFLIISFLNPSFSIESLADTINACDAFDYVGAFDIGSGSTKLKVARVSKDGKRLDRVVFNMDLPVAYQADLLSASNLDGCLSGAIVERGLDAMQTLKNRAEQELGCSIARYSGIATAVFRYANNADEVLARLSKSSGVDIMKLTQEEEGILGFYSILSHLGVDRVDHQKILTWDIGGGSLQLSFKDNDDQFVVLCGTIAAEEFRKQVVEQIKRRSFEETKTPNPMTLDEVKSAVVLARDLIDFPEHHTKELLAKLHGDQADVFGIGSVHTLCVKSLVNPGPDPFFTKEQLWSKILSLVGSTDDDFLEMPTIHIDRHLAGVQLTNLIFAYALMDEFHINKVWTYKTDGAEGMFVGADKALRQ